MYRYFYFQNTQKQVSIKARNFVSHQRQLLKKQLMKEPLMHEALSETMRNLMSGHKSSAERVLCHNCMRERLVSLKCFVYSFSRTFVILCSKTIQGLQCYIRIRNMRLKKCSWKISSELKKNVKIKKIYSSICS